MNSLRRLAVLFLVAAAGLALPGAAFAGHRHSRSCGHRYNDGYGRYDDRYRGHDSRYDHADRGYGYSYGSRNGYAAPSYRGYGYGYSHGYRSHHQCNRWCRHAPAYHGGYYDDSDHYGGYDYAPPPPRCNQRPRVGFYFGF